MKKAKYYCSVTTVLSGYVHSDRLFCGTDMDRVRFAAENDFRESVWYNADDEDPEVEEAVKNGYYVFASGSVSLTFPELKQVRSK